MHLLEYEFMRNALLAALLASVACGIIGSLVVVRRLVFISGGIAHAAFGGIGLGYFLGISPLVAVVPFTVACAILIGLINKQTKLPADTAIGILWAVSMAFGVIMIGFSPGYAPDLFGYLFGNILTVPSSDLWLMIGLDAIILIVVGLLFREFLAVSFDEEYAQASGLPVTFLYYLLLCLIALTIVLLIRVVGIVLVISMLTIPAAIAKQFARSLSRMMMMSSFLGIILTVSGLWLSYRFNLASGSTIILFSGLSFVLSVLLKRFI